MSVTAENKIIRPTFGGDGSKKTNEGNSVHVDTQAAPKAMQYNQAAETIPAKARQWPRQWPRQETNHSAPLHSGAFTPFPTEKNKPSMPQSGLTEAEKVKAWTKAVMAELLQKTNTPVPLNAEQLNTRNKHTMGETPLFGRKAPKSKKQSGPKAGWSANQDGDKPLTPFRREPKPTPTPTK